MKFIVELQAQDSRSVEIEASSPEEAVKLIGKPTDGAAITYVPIGVYDAGTASDRSWDVVGACEGCKTVLLDPPAGESARAVSMDEGGYLCVACAEAAAKEVNP